MNIYLIVGIAIYVVSVILAYGASFAYMQGMYPILAKHDYWRDIGEAVAFSLLGPISLFVVHRNSRFRFGFKFW